MPRTARDPMPDHAPLLQDAETDPALMARVATGDRAAFDLLASRHLLRLRRAAMRVLDDPAAAENVAQDAIMRSSASPSETAAAGTLTLPPASAGRADGGGRR